MIAMQYSGITKPPRRHPVDAQIADAPDTEPPRPSSISSVIRHRRPSLSGGARHRWSPTNATREAVFPGTMKSRTLQYARRRTP